jgi:hypothetical protein
MLKNLSNAMAARCLRFGRGWSAMAPYSRAIQKANGAGWFVSKLTGDGAFEVILAQRRHEFRASSDERMAA